MEGVTVIVTVIFELPIFHYASSVLRWLGNPGTMLQWASLAYITRVIGYSFIPKDHPNIVLLLEPLHGVTIGKLVVPINGQNFGVCRVIFVH